ncbi:GNAT family N-acetyltransferase [Argonema galeatum]|uniref:GNAT family N-acetyltransferase n=1 Tax=Argonema galeatum TaxID=2942762 RepID=UPI002012725E|nr:GNAT family N-acetyltransferase [Argonema galeatum]MCL1464996.1 GNAT family N-acetyltransferase [Argonema galeatum A003/A1]
MTDFSNSLPPECILRPASSSDIWAIRKLVLSAKLDPTQLRWQQFWVIESDKTLVACGQLRSFPEAQELGSLVVASPWRGKGLGSYLVKYLIQRATQPLYLECLGKKLVQFYHRFGFVPVSWQDLPSSLKWKFGLTQLASKLVPIISVTIMQYPKFELPVDEKQTPLP